MSKQLSSNKLSTIGDYLNYAFLKLKEQRVYCGHGTDNHWDEAVYLVFSCLGLPLDSERSILVEPVAEQSGIALLAQINKRIHPRIPVAYLNNRVFFAGLEFYLDQRTIIPRSPIAELIMNRFDPWVTSSKVKRILDLGTGCGCIAISAALAFPKTTVDAVDISLAALEVAKINCQKHQVSDRVNLILSDLFANIEGVEYDIIVSNPPYVGESEEKTLPKEYFHEPRSALIAGVRGDEIITRIMDQAVNFLAPDGILVVEVGNSFALVENRYSKLPLLWLEFEHGVGEVFLVTKKQLLALVINE